MHRTIFFLGIIFSISSHLSYGQTIIKSFDFGPFTRDYRLHIPPTYTAGEKVPLVINMHGLGSNGFEQELYSEFSNISDTANFIVAYPNGVNNAWNSGFVIGGTDDVGFISAMIDSIGQEYSIDASRIYATGMSNGGYMSYYLACELSERIAAIASVTGSMNEYVVANCDPGRAIPVLQMHGTQDGVVPYGGSPGLAVHMDSVMAFWVRYNGCTTPGDSTPIPDVAREIPPTTVTRIDYNACDDSSEVLFFRVQGGGHTWPGAFPLPNQITNNDIKGSLEIWEFFKRHTHPFPQNITSVSPKSTLALTLYPNPVSNQLIIRLDQSDLETITVMNAMGQEVLRQSFSFPQNQVAVTTQSWSAGMYWVRVKSRAGVGVRKVLKK